MKLPQLHLRDLFWLVLLCGVAIGWWLEHYELVKGRRRIDALSQNERHLSAVAKCFEAEFRKAVTYDYFLTRDTENGQMRIEKLP